MREMSYLPEGLSFEMPMNETPITQHVTKQEAGRLPHRCILEYRAPTSMISRNPSRFVFFLRKLCSMSVNVSCFISRHHHCPDAIYIISDACLAVQDAIRGSQKRKARTGGIF